MKWNTEATEKFNWIPARFVFVVYCDYSFCPAYRLHLPDSPARLLANLFTFLRHERRTQLHFRAEDFQRVLHMKNENVP